MPAHENTKPIQVVEPMMTILNLIAQNREPMSLHMIAQAANLHPSTVHRLLWNLADYGYLTRNSNGSWKLGLRFLEYGCLVRDRLVIGEVALPIMQELYKITGQTINLAVRHDDNMIYIEHVYSPQRGARLARQNRLSHHYTVRVAASSFYATAHRKKFAATSIAPNLRHAHNSPSVHLRN